MKVLLSIVGVTTAWSLFGAATAQGAEPLGADLPAATRTLMENNPGLQVMRSSSNPASLHALYGAPFFEDASATTARELADVFLDAHADTLGGDFTAADFAWFQTNTGGDNEFKTVLYRQVTSGTIDDTTRLNIYVLLAAR